MSNSLSKGDFAELLFDLTAIKNGLNVSKPNSAYLPYDRVVEYEGRILKVQIKMCTKKRVNRNVYQIKLTDRADKSYKLSSVDVFALYIMPLDKWFLLRNEERSVFFYKDGMKLSSEENWELLKQPI